MFVDPMPSRVLKIPIQIPSKRKKSRRRRWEILAVSSWKQSSPGKRKGKKLNSVGIKKSPRSGQTHTHRGACNKKKRKMDEIGALKVICAVLFSVVLYCLYSMLSSANGSARRNHLGGLQLFSFVLPKGSFPCNSSVNNSI
jgi:hypothetical protein